MITDTSWMADYVTRRELILAIGYRWDEPHALWRKGKKVLTDEQLDRIRIERLQAYLQKRGQRRSA